MTWVSEKILSHLAILMPSKRGYYALWKMLGVCREENMAASRSDFDVSVFYAAVPAPLVPSTANAEWSPHWTCSNREWTRRAVACYDCGWWFTCPVQEIYRAVGQVWKSGGPYTLYLPRSVLQSNHCTIKPSVSVLTYTLMEYNKRLCYTPGHARISIQRWSLEEEVHLWE